MGRSSLAMALRVAGIAPVTACAPGHASAADAGSNDRAAPVVGFDATGSDVNLTPSEGGARSEADGGAASDALAFDLGADFSFSRNPNGAWRYGFTVGTALGVDQFKLDSFVADSGADPIAFWHPADPATNAAGNYPYVAENSGSVSASEESSWALRPREVAIEGSNSGQYGVVQFVAPVAGKYRVQAHFEGIHFRLSTTDVHVLAGDAGLFASNISGYGGDPAFHVVEGANPTADYDGTVPLQANDVVTFAIGYGTNMTNYNDTTGLTVHIDSTGN
jgi:hypothetical protein